MAAPASKIYDHRSFLEKILSDMKELLHSQAPKLEFCEKVNEIANKIFEKQGLSETYSPHQANLQERCQVLYHWLDWAEKIQPKEDRQDHQAFSMLKMRIVNAWAQARGIRINWQLRGDGFPRMAFI
jgi:predicted sulfurtransferase